ncbi:glycogen synthase [Cellvibrio zantedeschiae]|uniref:Glycogen synthase n=1 Tax=Cellvibrio zantedeschiae TaxID=1237077 RepID=A0ABQ3B306_9GAMM|nr:glycogen synthase GlgA [Cellvibrio zantedeschiae]GGY71857.1 glycogen synthase [Cellvibrio zantedeschiae]
MLESHAAHTDTNRRSRRNILFVTSEHADLIKVGGLGDVSSALPKALLAFHDIRVLIPGYFSVLNSDHRIDIIAHLPAYANLPECDLGCMQIKNGPIIYVLICPELYEREGNPYSNTDGQDWSDNHIRFARLGLAAAQIAQMGNKLDWSPHIIHANDWPAALAPAYIKWQGINIPSVFTVHNLAHQGLFSPDCLPALGLPLDVFTIEGMEFHGKISFLKAGLVYASHITTVSQTYAREITTPEHGCGLDGLLKTKFNQGLLSGIINGIDESWEPLSDPHLVEGFGARQWSRKLANTRHVEKLFGLHHSNGPLFAVVSRLAHQKGLDLTLGVVKTIVRAGGRLVVMGTGESRLEAELERLARQHPQQIGVHIGFNEAEARRIFAGSDFLLMPSRFEPCGLSQMYAQSFGSLPIAHRTGGLVDTIEDGVTGFLFRGANIESYRNAVQRALYVFKHPNLLSAMRCRAMASPPFWQDSVQPYDNLYRSLLKKSENGKVIFGNWRAPA